MAFAVIILWTIISNSPYYLSDSPEVVVKKIYRTNPFNESIPISEFIESHTNPDDRIQVLGPNPRYIFTLIEWQPQDMYMYGLMEPQKFSSLMQLELINDLARINPKIIIFCHIKDSWLVQSKSDEHLQNWSNYFINKYYNLVGVVDIGEETKYKWMDDAVSYQPVSRNFIYVLERKR